MRVITDPRHSDYWANIRAMLWEAHAARQALIERIDLEVNAHVDELNRLRDLRAAQTGPLLR